MRIFIMILAIILLLLAAISMFSPIPGGTLFLGVGGALLICTSNRAAKKIGDLRSRFPRIDKGMRWLEDRLWHQVSEALRRTRPSDPSL